MLGVVFVRILIMINHFVWHWKQKRKMLILMKRGESRMHKNKKLILISISGIILLGVILLITKTYLNHNYQIKLEEVPQNTIFTEDTFEGIVGIRKDLWDIEIRDRETVETLCNLLAGVTLKKWTNGKLSYEGKYFSGIYELIYENGETKKFILSNERLEYDNLCYRPGEDIASAFLNSFYKIRKERGETNRITLSQKPQNSIFTEELFQELMAVKYNQIEITDKAVLEEWCNTLAGLKLEEYTEKEEKSAFETIYGYNLFLLEYENGETREFILSKRDVLSYEEKEYKVGDEAQEKIWAPFTIME